jgi:hypothetical protein
VGSGAACATIAKVQAAINTSLEVRQRDDPIRLQTGRNTLNI